MISDRYERLISGAGLLAILLISSCGPAPSSGEQAGQNASEQPVETAAKQEPAPSFLDPILGAPWLGHADSGALVQVEFFVNRKTAATACRVNVNSTQGLLRPQQSAFSATADLSGITWGDGKSRGTYYPDQQALDVTIATQFGVERAQLRQTSAAQDPTLAAPRTFIPDNDATRAEHKKFTDRLARGTRWWKSGVPWDKVTTPPEIIPPAQPLALIWPTPAKPLTLPALEVGGRFELDITCHLPPGTKLDEGATTVGVFIELQNPEVLSSTWALQQLNPVASIQQIKGTWVATADDPLPTGATTLHVYLAKVNKNEADGTPSIDINRPISNHLEMEVSIGAAATPAE